MSSEGVHGTRTDAQRELWDRHARRDPLWAILTDGARTQRGWDIADVMKSGEREIALLMLDLQRCGLGRQRRRAVDFGCGVGRLTQALGRRFEHVIGLDISPEMRRLADQISKYPNVEYRRSDGPDGLAALPSASCDLVYSNIVLQHIEPTVSRGIIPELFRLAAPGAAVVFQLPAEEIAAPVPHSPRPMPDDAYHAGLALVSCPSRVARGETFVVSVTVENTSARRWWQPDIGSLRLGNHWRDAGGARMLVQDDGREPLPQEVEPGAKPCIFLSCTALDQVGVFTLEVDIVHEGITWFADRGNTTQRLTIEVTGDAAPAVRKDLLEELDVPAYDQSAFEQLLDAPPEPDEAAPPVPVFGIPRCEVEEIIRTSGGELLRVEEDGRAGPGWHSYRYFSKSMMFA